jgi:ferric-dicitrate binding protein FerR (iron transport regulator)
LQQYKENTTDSVTYFEAHPEKLNEYISEQEWENFQCTEDFSEEKSEALWNKIYRQTHKLKTFNFYLKRFAVAASILVSVAAGWFLLYDKKMNNHHLTAKTETKTQQKMMINNGAKKMIFFLSDSSTVELMPQSTLSFPEKFSENKRDVVLNGEAFFNIHKNRNKPFTVYSDALATTVLGTKFSVKSFSSDKNISIALYEGKVVVTSADSVVKKLDKDFYLAPGQTLLYNKSAMTAFISQKQKTGFAKSNAKNKTELSPENIANNNWYMFNNQPLAEVLDQLQKLYNQKIIYSQADVKGKSFICKLDHSDSLEHVLHSIALLNQLKLIKTDEGYILKK